MRRNQSQTANTTRPKEEKAPEPIAAQIIRQNSVEDLQSCVSSSAMGGFEFPENKTYTTHEKLGGILDFKDQIQPVELSSKQMSAIKECQLPEMEASPCKIPRKDISSLTLYP